MYKRGEKGMAEGSELPDAVVIRLQDIFAEGALWTYANEIRAAIDVMKWLDVKSNEVVRLEEIADYFADVAVAASSHVKKVPD